MFQFSKLILFFLFAFTTFSYSDDVARVRVSDVDCAQRDWRELSFSGISAKTFLTDQRPALDRSACDASAINLKLDELEGECEEFFDVMNITPITEGVAEMAKDTYSNYSAHQGYGYGYGWGMGYGYSYTSHILITYRCL